MASRVQVRHRTTPGCRIAQGRVGGNRAFSGTCPASLLLTTLSDWTSSSVISKFITDPLAFIAMPLMTAGEEAKRKVTTRPELERRHVLGSHTRLPIARHAELPSEPQTTG